MTMVAFQSIDQDLMVNLRMENPIWLVPMASHVSLISPSKLDPDPTP